MKKVSLILFVLFALLTNEIIAQHQNIMISSSNAPEEPTIYINPKNTNELYSLIIRAIEGNISDEDFLALLERLNSSDSDCEAYAEAVMMS